MELRKPLIWSPEADLDLEKTLEYLEKNWTEKVLIDFLNEQFKVLDWISENPVIFMKSKDESSIRKYVFSKHHTLYFEIFDTHIHLLRIFDTRQDPTSLKY
jgi:plasmid stabilization system protein ParE